MTDVGDDTIITKFSLASISIDTTSCIVGLSKGDALVQKNAIFRTNSISSTTFWLKSMHSSNIAAGL